MNPIDDFLDKPPSLPVNAEAREATFGQTAALLPKRSRPRWPIAVAVAACIALGIASAYFVFFHGEGEKKTPDRKQDLARETKDTPKEPEQILPLDFPDWVQAKKAPPPTPRELEWNAFDAEDDTTRVRLYFQAGDLYLARFDDVQSALRCYQQAIHFCDARDLEVTPDDNWLVMALKRDHRKEK